MDNTNCKKCDGAGFTMNGLGEYTGICDGHATPGTGTTASAAGVSMADIGKAAMDWSEKYSSAFRATRENAPAAWDGLMKLVRAYGAALAEEARREAEDVTAAWHKVVMLLEELSPGYFYGRDGIVDKVIATIRKLAQRTAGGEAVQVQTDAWGVQHKPSGKWVTDSGSMARVSLLSKQIAENLCINADYVARPLRIEITTADSGPVAEAAAQADDDDPTMKELHTRAIQGAATEGFLNKSFAPQADPIHPDDRAVDRFAAAMKSKMAASRAKGRGGWDDPAQCQLQDLARMLVEHVEKGDPVDIGNFAMMLWNRKAMGFDIIAASLAHTSAAPTAQPTPRPAANAGRNAAQPTPPDDELEAARAEWAENHGAESTPDTIKRIANLIHAIRIGGRPSEQLAYLRDWLEDERAALRQPGALPDEAEDAARLDWLQEKQATLTRLFDNSAYILSVAGRAVRTGVKVRDLIDAARVAAKQAGKEA